MGKKKDKKCNVFKVAGAKSLKLKSKAKPIDGHLKSFQIKVKEKVLEIDGLLKSMQGDLCTTGNGSGGGNKNDKGVVGGGDKQSKKKLKEASQRLEYDQLQKKSKEVINDLETMSM